MVFKIDKRRVYSGNTLRASNSRYNRQYRRQSCLVRRSQNVSNVTGIFKELGLDRDDVVYSFNKKGRWLIPQILKQEILTDSKDLGDVKVDLVESHKLKKQGKCTGFHSNKGFLQKVVPKKTYFNVASLQGPKKEEVTPSATPHMTINIMYPCPATSSIAHNPKYIRYEDLPTDGLDEDDIDRTQHSSPIKSKARKQRRKIGTKQWVDNYLDEVEHYDDEDYEIDSTENVREPSKSVSVEDILVHSRRIESILSGGAKVSKYPATRRETKDRVIFINRQDEEEKAEEKEEMKSMAIKETTSPMEYVGVNIPTNEVSIETLKHRFGESYIECRCSPRKFIIDITKEVQKTLLKSKAFRHTDIMTTDLSTVLVFVYDVFGSLDNNDADRFKILLNMKTKKIVPRINTFQEDSVFGVEDIVSEAVSYIETIPCDEFIHRDSILPYTRQASTKFEMLAESRGTKPVSIDPVHLRVTVKDLLQRKEEDIDEAESLIAMDFESLPPDTCSICCEAIESSATALQTCGHWFCDRCWGDHLLSVANSGSGRITCPEYKCRSTIDYAILLTTSNIEVVENVFRRRLMMKVDIDPDSKWCPNKHCGRAIKCEKNAMGQRANITCSCGTHICFECLKPAHWPLSCDHFGSYSHTLQKNGDESAPDVNYIRFAQGKECPKCKQFMEKNGGCFYMTCRCGCSFCWGCGKSFENHVNSKECRPRRYRPRDNGDLFNTKKRALIVPSINDKTKGYKRAVEYRCLRQAENVRIMTSAVHKMSTSLKMLNRRYGDRVGGELVDFLVPKFADEMTVADKIKPFLHSMVGVYTEISHICELTTVFLERSNNVANLKRSSRQAVIITRDRLASIGDGILHVLRSSSKENMKVNIPHLWKLRFQCKKAMDTLVKLLKC
ncbi:uncharacterized protein LOC110443868 [Mizuhopecten yessoensis]|uniref:uncharacterized protein LOC110443868 n=1 Tax=Mizuhopecten yessoensis TaxID=6573 RepID=UPI000B459F05|nr:uncharacterized protein LOC110443868 [Mizuhopecten yessoensis]